MLWMLSTILAQAISSPSPAPCTQKWREASILRQAAPKVSQQDLLHAEAVGGKLTATVTVMLSPDGKVETAQIYRSTGDPILDAAAVMAVRSSTFAPKMSHCKGLESKYLFQVNFP